MHLKSRRICLYHVPFLSCKGHCSFKGYWPLWVWDLGALAKSTPMVMAAMVTCTTEVGYFRDSAASKASESEAGKHSADVRVLLQASTVVAL